MSVARSARLHEETVRSADSLAPRRRPYVRRAAAWRPADRLHSDYRSAEPAGPPPGVHPGIWAAALKVAGGDRRRLQVVSPVKVVVR